MSLSASEPPQKEHVDGASAGVRDGKVARAECTAKDAFTMLATFKSLPDALKVVTQSRSSNEQSTEDGLLQLHIGLDGTCHTVPFRHGMSMDQLKEKVTKITGIPVAEQIYVFADDARLVDPGSLVPLEEPLRCVRTVKIVETSSTDDVDPEAVGTSTDASDKESEDSSTEDSSSIQWQPDSNKQRESWADLTEAVEHCAVSWADVEDDSLVWKVNYLEQETLKDSGEYSPCSQNHPCDSSSRASMLTERWRRWDENERQHQFYIPIPESCITEHQVPQRIKKACSGIYKANIMVRLRGRGSGFFECRQGRTYKESTDPLMICISGRKPYSLDEYWHAFYLIASLLEDDICKTYNDSAIDRRCGRPEVHLEDDCVHGGVRLHGEAEASTSSASGPFFDDERSSGALRRAREFTDAWRAWDEAERQHQFLIMIPDSRRDEFQVVKRIKNACRDIYTENVVLRCRGRGSGFVEGRRKSESTDPLMICLSGRKDKYSPEEYWSAFYKLAAFLEADLYAEYNTSVANSCTKNRTFKEVRLHYSDVHGGVRKGGRVNN